VERESTETQDGALVATDLPKRAVQHANLLPVGIAIVAAITAWLWAVGVWGHGFARVLVVAGVPIGAWIALIAGTIAVLLPPRRHAEGRERVGASAWGMPARPIFGPDRAGDGLTGLGDRDWFEEHLREEVEGARRAQQPLSMLLVDIDGLKEVNVRDGRSAGDAVIRTVSRTLASASRAEDFLARTGDDELAVLAPATDAAGALALAHRIRMALLLGAREDRGTLPRTSISIGVAQCRGTAEQLLRDTREALARAKAGGRDRAVLLADGPGPEPEHIVD
jgi:diguanylate cyclase (GGDEF)-like protein